MRPVELKIWAIKVEKRNIKDEFVSSSIGKNINVYKNSYFNMNNIKVVFTECLQYGQFSMHSLLDHHANSEKQRKSPDSKLPGFKSSVPGSVAL